MTDFAMLLNISSICIGLVGSYSVCNIADYIANLPDSFEVFPLACQEVILKDVCANMYLKCAPEMLNYDIYPGLIVDGENYSLPFQRPCLRVCSDIQSKCAGVPSFLGYVVPSCDEKYDYSNGVITSVLPFKYDQNHNSALCNGMGMNTKLNSTNVLRVTSEPYTYATDKSGACYGMVDSPVYIPPITLISTLGLPVNDSLDPLPLSVQAVLEDGLHAAFNSVPIWLNKKCFVALKRYVCGNVLKEPIVVNLADGLLSSYIYGDDYTLGNWIMNTTIAGDVSTVSGLDMLDLLAAQEIIISATPSQDLCNEYAAECGDFLTIANDLKLTNGLTRISSLLHPNCSAVRKQYSVILQDGLVTDGILNNSKPSSSSKIILSDAPTSTLEFDDSFSSILYQPTCPSYFGSPEMDLDVTFIAGTGCIEKCKSSQMSPDEWDALKIIALSSGCMSLLLLSVLVGTRLLHKVKRKQYSVNTLMVLSLLLTLCLIIEALLPFEYAFCSNWYTPISASDGFTLCAFQNLLLVYTFLCLSLSWCWVSSMTVVKLLYDYSPSKRMSYRMAVVVFGIPMITLLVVLRTGTFGYYEGSYLCVSRRSRIALVSEAIPLLVSVVMSFINCIIIVTTIFRRISGTSYRSMENLYLLIGPFNFLLVSSVFWVVILASMPVFQLTNSDEESGKAGDFLSWVECAFYNDFLGEFTTWTVPGCGSHYPNRFNVDLIALMFFFAYGHGSIIFLIYLVEFYSIWKVWLGFKKKVDRKKQELPVSHSTPGQTPRLLAPNTVNVKVVPEEHFQRAVTAHKNTSVVKKSSIAADKSQSRSANRSAPIARRSFSGAPESVIGFDISKRIEKLVCSSHESLNKSKSFHSVLPFEAEFDLGRESKGSYHDISSVASDSSAMWALNWGIKVVPSSSDFIQSGERGNSIISHKPDSVVSYEQIVEEEEQREGGHVEAWMDVGDAEKMGEDDLDKHRHTMESMVSEFMYENDANNSNSNSIRNSDRSN